MAGYENVKNRGFDTLTPDERREIASKGAKASAEVRRRKKLMREEADALLARRCVNPEGRAALKAIGKVGKDGDGAGDNQAAIIAAQVVKAMNGDIVALQFLRDTMGEAPVNLFATENKHSISGIDDGIEVNINVLKD